MFTQKVISANSPVNAWAWTAIVGYTQGTITNKRCHDNQNDLLYCFSAHSCAFELAQGIPTDKFVTFFMSRVNMLLYYKVTPVVSHEPKRE
jgi:hypothetical protein